MARINQYQEISPQITRWNQQGSEVIQGTLLVIPIEEALLYVRPMYLRASGGRIPELKQVVVAYQNQIVMEATLDLALKRLFSGSEPADFPAAASTILAETESGLDTQTSSDLPRTETLTLQAQDYYNRALRAQRDGDWAQYGVEIEQLGNILEQLQGGQ